MIRYRIGLAAFAAAVATLAWTLPAGAQQSTAKVTTITVTAGKPAEFRFTLSKKSAPHGIVIFKVTNKGIVPHDFKIAGRKTKLISPGQSNTLRVSMLKQGTYPYQCTVSGHAVAGMKGVFRIT